VVIKEAIRLHPSVGMMLARTVPTGGRETCGHYVTAGTEVRINPWVIHRDNHVFTDPNRFFPERWLDLTSEEEQLKMMNRCFFCVRSWCAYLQWALNQHDGDNLVDSSYSVEV
jgi:cytochrome P450